MLYRRRLETRNWDINSCLQCLLREYIKREVESLYRLLYNQRSRPLVVRGENAAFTHEAYTSIQPEESPPGGQGRECSFYTWSIYFYTTRGVATWWSGERMQLLHMKHILLYNQRSRSLVVRREDAAFTHEAYTSIQPEEPPGGQGRECSFYTWRIDFYTTRGVAPWWSGERMQLLHMKHRLLYNQRSR